MTTGPQATFWEGIKNTPHRRAKTEAKKAADRRWYKNNREKAKELTSQWRKNNPARNKELKALYRKKYPGKERMRSRRHLGIKNPTGEIKFGTCPFCSDEKIHKLRMDHDHDTGVVRGWLCSPHNLALGHWEQFEQMRPRVLAYLAAAQSIAS